MSEGLSELGRAIEKLQDLAGLEDGVRSQGLLILGLSRDKFAAFGAPELDVTMGALTMTWHGQERGIFIKILPQGAIKYYSELNGVPTFYDESGWVSLG